VKGAFRFRFFIHESVPHIKQNYGEAG